ncbi:cytochrome b5-like heme/steroid binding domain-containing protein [Aquiluna sp.]|nr:cytochrome b5-like heme/steroid binding domain-containing protein [Aquiluna sp.]
MEEFFLMLLGLPAHPLLVHFAVVLFPVAALGVAAIVAIPKLRARFPGAGVIALALTIPFVFAAVQSGEALEEVYYEPEPHSEYGEMMMPIALGTLAVAVAVWLAIKYSWPKLIASSLGFLMVSAAIGASAMTFVVGHSGAEATWGGKSELFIYEDGYDDYDKDNDYDESSAPVAPGGGADSPAANGSGLTIREVANHSSKSDCWVIIDDGVYVLDGYMAKHPGGTTVLAALCGTDGTEAFQSQHARQALPKAELDKLYLGKLGTSVQAQQPGTAESQDQAQPSASVISQEQLLAHGTLDSCWAAVDGVVYDLSGYGAEHPGGASQIQALCGTDATAAFSSEHGFVGTPANVLAAMKIGELEAGATLPPADIVYGEGDDDEDEDRDDEDDDEDEDHDDEDSEEA